MLDSLCLGLFTTVWFDGFVPTNQYGIVRWFVFGIIYGGFVRWIVFGIIYNGFVRWFVFGMMKPLC